jgi:hypothetical protein
MPFQEKWHWSQWQQHGESLGNGMDAGGHFSRFRSAMHGLPPGLRRRPGSEMEVERGPWKEHDTPQGPLTSRLSAQLRWFSSDHPPRILCTQPLTHVPRRNQPAGQCPDCASAMTGRPRTWSVLITTNRKRPHLGVGSERTVGSLMSWCRVWLLVTPKLRLQPRRPAATLRRPLGAAVQ